MVYLSDPPYDESDQPKEEKPAESIIPEEETKNRIKILAERDIPFQEERPPNLSPNYEVKIYRVRRQKSVEASKE